MRLGGIVIAVLMVVEASSVVVGRLVGGVTLGVLIVRHPQVGQPHSTAVGAAVNPGGHRLSQIVKGQ